MANAKNDNLLSGRVPHQEVISEFYDTLPGPRKQVGLALELAAELWNGQTDATRKLLLAGVINVKEVASVLGQAMDDHLKACGYSLPCEEVPIPSLELEKLPQKAKVTKGLQKRREK